jgi:hypothetical protein
MAEGDDPAPNVVKTLSVEYTLAGKPSEVKATDPETMHIGGEPVHAVVQKATYGILDDPKRTRDVREKLQRLLDSGFSSFRVSQMADGDDPAYLVVKTLEADLLIQGKPVHLSGTDPELIDLSIPLPAAERIADFRRSREGRLLLQAWQPGKYELTTASGRRLTFDVAAPQRLDVQGPWTLRFPPNLGAPAQVQLDHLVSWSEHSDPGIKCFSGTATYSRALDVPKAVLGKTKRLYLDLGEVHAFARVRLNGRDLGVLWKPPFEVDITDAARPGDNRLEIELTNLWPNRMIGDEQLPEDSERNENGTLKRWPEWLLEGRPSPTGRFTFTSWRLWKKTDAPLRSGLIGPVRLVGTETFSVAN